MIKKATAVLIVFVLLLSMAPAVYAGEANFNASGFIPFFMKFFKPVQTQPEDQQQNQCPPVIPPPCVPPPCIPPPCVPPPCSLPCLFGSLTVTKSLCAPAGFDINKQFEFTLRNAAGHVVGTAVIGDGGSATFGCLIPGKYTITESAADVTDYDWYVAVSGAANENGGCLTICPGDQAVAFTNTYIKHTGELTITKQLCAPLGFNKCKEFNITVFDSANAVAATAVLKGGESATFTLDVGTYTILESDAEVCGYCLKVEVSGAACENGGSLTVAQGSQEVVFLNTYKYKLPKLFPCFPGCNDSLPVG